MADPQRVRSVFLEAVEHHSPDQWGSFLDRACGGERELRDRVEVLLRAHDQANSLLDVGPVPAETIDAAPAEAAGTMIGPYKLLEVIGEGGMGTVWMAEQQEPVRRLVAVKVIKAGMDTKHVLARFEAERQALALMDHPNIAKVFDGGTTGELVRRASEGEGPSLALRANPARPYFVMELVKGVPITKYCDDHHLTPRQRLELFIPVCQAVQHAHQKGVIHRDIKPSNVLVAQYDDRPVPKVIDFGVAKATGQQLTDQTLHTGFGAVVGTVEYMSPEQASFNQLDVDTRSDIYSLGVLLYELLTGSTPFTTKDLEKSGMLEMLRVIREQEPTRPSTKLSTADGLPTLAANRGTEPAKLTRLVRGELDWIVMKALEKDRNRRYETANSLAMDVQRYLADEAVQACPPSAGYRLRKFARRNKGALAFAFPGVIGLLLAVIGLAVNNWLVNREKEQKEAALTRAVEEKDRADKNLAEARRAAREFLLKTSDNPLLKSADFQNLRKELLESALPFLQEFVRQSHEDPQLEFERGRAYQDLGALHRELGDQEHALDDLARAEDIFQRLSKTNPGEPEFAHELAGTLITRGVILNELARFDQAENAFRLAILILEPLGPEYRATVAQATSNLGELFRELDRRDDAETTLRQAILLRTRLLEEQPEGVEIRGQLAQTKIHLGALLLVQRQVDNARRAFEEAIELLNADPVRKLPDGSALALKCQQIRARAWNNLGVIHANARRYGDSEKAHREALAVKESLAETFPSLPQYRQELARSYNNLGTLLAARDRRKESQAAYEKAVSIYERLVAGGSAVPLYAVELAGTYTNLGRLIGDSGQLEESLPHLTRSVEILAAEHRKDSRVAKVRESLLVAHWARAMTLAGLRRFSPAVDDWNRAIDLDDGRYYCSLRLKRASTLLNLKDHGGAVADAQAIANSPRATAADLYNAACVCALSARFAADDAVRAETYGSHAVAMLHQAFARGFKDVAHLKTDADLDPLRSREDFKKLMHEWAGGEKGSGGKKPETDVKKP